MGGFDQYMGEFYLSFFQSFWSHVHHQNTLLIIVLVLQ